MDEAKIAQLIVDYFDLYGYYLVFAFLLAENTFMLGLLIPGETILITASFIAAAGNLNIGWVITIGAIAAMLGNNFGYLIGRVGGRALMERVGTRWLSQERIDAAEDYFDKHGQKTVFIGRFVAGVRTFVPVLAGAARMSYPKFLAYTVASVIAWTMGLGLLGYFFGENRAILLTIIKRGEVGILIALIAGLTYVLWRKWRKRSGQDAGSNGA